ncbi:hypothetical protein A0H81_14336 [Grifola frondosa]|uniref:Uncharacterized protein n=1 Tax=Grifola frondosa TaxID=5627 RepID=A0A1C7LNI8_GRIFR|nr:hypothetical protein A0H81_14336 [Grifola frondosa]
MTGTPVSNWTLMSACDTLSEMYSKCIVEPLMSTPIAMTASNGSLGIDTATGAGVEEREPKEGVDVPKLNPPRRSVAVAPAWTWEPAITLQTRKGQFEAAGHGLHDNVRLLHAELSQLGDGARDERTDHGGVPSGVDNGNTKRGTVELRAGGSRAFDRVAHR